MSNEWREYFPKLLEPRPEQKIILDEIVAGFANGFTDIFVEAATGIGKSAIAVTKARMLSAIAITEARMQKGKSYIMTTDISLEDQYVIDFGSFLNQLHSSVNYEECPSCSNCSIGNTGQPKKCLQVLENKVLDTIMSSHQIPCDYQRARWIFEHGKIKIANIVFITNYMKSRRFKQRELAIFDEAHTVGEKISEQYVINIKKGKCGIASLPSQEAEIIEWSEEAIPILENKSGGLQVFLDNSWGIPESAIVEAKKEKRIVDQQLATLTLIRSTGEKAWVFDLSSRLLVARPKWPYTVTRRLLYRIADKRLYLTATLPGEEKQIQWLGVDTEKALFLTIDSPFPAKNRMIYKKPCISWSYKKDQFASAFRQLPSAIDEILEYFPDWNGIIHCMSFQQVHVILDGCNSSRLFTHGRGSKAKDKALKRLYSTPGAVLVSPSCHHGVDLKDNRARFQVIIKIPWPFFGDKLVQARNKEDPEWPVIKASQTLQQACGRATRHMKDWSITIIIDSQIGWFINRNNQYFPEWMKKAIRTWE